MQDNIRRMVYVGLYEKNGICRIMLEEWYMQDNIRRMVYVG